MYMIVRKVIFGLLKYNYKDSDNIQAEVQIYPYDFLQFFELFEQMKKVLIFYKSTIPLFTALIKGSPLLPSPLVSSANCITYLQVYLK